MSVDFHRHRAGAAVVVMVVVLSGVAISLLVLAGKTSIQMKSIQNVALETQQRNELIALGEIILDTRLASNPEYQGESIQLELPDSLVAEHKAHSQLGIIELVIKDEASTETEGQWSIIASVGANESNLRHSSKLVKRRHLPLRNNPNE